MTPRHDQQERLRALGLDASPAARRLRARIPRPAPEPAEGIPSAPYSVDAWPERDPRDRAPVPPDPDATRTVRTPPPRDPPPWTGARLPHPPPPTDGTTERLRPPRDRPGPAPDSALPPPAHRTWAADPTETATPWRHPTPATPRTTAEPPQPTPPEHPTNTAAPTRQRSNPGTRWNATKGPEPTPPEHPHRHAANTTPWQRPNAGTQRSTAEAAEPTAPEHTHQHSANPAAPARRPMDSAAAGDDGAPPRRGDAGRADGAGAGAEGVPRVPSGYTELLPRQGGVVARLARRWPPEATMSRRAVAALLVVALAAVGAMVFLRERPTEAVAPETVAHTLPAEAATPSAAAADPEADVVVHVGGEVEDPGLYTLPPGSRVADAVEAAGGALPDADMDLLNLARSLVDGEQILVGLPQPEAAVPSAGTAEGPLVNINLADEAELDALPRVGEVTAGNIVSYREANGPFTSVDDLINVDRIGAKTLEEIRPHVTVG